MGESEKRPSISPGRALAVLTAVLAVLLLFCPSGRSEAQANPFFKSPAPSAPSRIHAHASAVAIIYDGLYYLFRATVTTALASVSSIPGLAS